MGFKEERARLIEALQSDRYTNEERSDGEEKNLLASGAVDAESIVLLLRRCAGWEYSRSRHHFRDADCHVFTPTPWEASGGT
jgi:hypothetical protein